MRGGGELPDVWTSDRNDQWMILHLSILAVSGYSVVEAMGETYIAKTARNSSHLSGSRRRCSLQQDLSSRHRSRVRDVEHRYRLQQRDDLIQRSELRTTS